MTLTAQVKLNALYSMDEDDILGVFAEGELRGVAEGSSRLFEGRSLFFVQIYANQVSGEVLRFRIYDASEDRVIEAVTMLSFQNDLSVGSVNEPYLVTENYGPTELTLSQTRVAENLVPMTRVGYFSARDPDPGERFVFSLVSGEGSIDNNAFRITGNELQVLSSLDFETKDNYVIRVRVADVEGEYIERRFFIAVIDQNDPPNGIRLSRTALPENTALGGVASTLITDDVDINASTYTYSFVIGTGGEDNASFYIQGNRLLLNTSLDFERKTTYAIRLRSEDAAGLAYEQNATLSITNVNEAPTGLMPSRVMLSETTMINQQVSTLQVVDPDAADTHTLRLLSTASPFGLRGNQLILVSALDYETRTQYFLDISITDAGGASIIAQLPISVQNENERATDIVLATEQVDELLAMGGLIGRLSTTDDDRDSQFNYSLVAGEGSRDNNRFAIQGEEIRSAAMLDYETRNSYQIRVRSANRNDATDFIEEAFVIDIEDRNEPPTDLSLMIVSSDEELPPGTVMGNFSLTDPDALERHTYLLIAGSADDDNDFFIINGNLLKVRRVMDYETQSTYSIRVRAVDNQGLAVERAFSIPLTDRVETPSAIQLSSDTLVENSAPNTLIGNLSLASPGSLSSPIRYLMLSTPDRSYFRIQGNQLFSTTGLNHESRSFYTLRIRAEDNASNSLVEDFVITVTNRNEAPTSIALSPASIDENLGANTTVGILSTTDPDVGDSFTYTLVDGEGSANNDLFAISGNQLRSRGPFNYEENQQYSLRIRTSDRERRTVEHSFVVRVNDVNEPPTNVRFTPEQMAENQPPGTRIGAFTTTDPDANERFSYELVSGAGSTHNNYFFMSGGEIFISRPLDYEQTPRVFVRLRVQDRANHRLDEEMILVVEDQNDPHTNLRLSSSSVAERARAGTQVGLFSVDDSDNSPLSYQIIETSLAGAFRIRENRLETAISFDYEQQNLVAIRIEASDRDGNRIREGFQIAIINENDPPTGFSLQNTQIAENEPAGTLVGLLSLEDVDGGSENDYVYSLAGGMGGEDNADFRIQGNELLSAERLDYETSARLRVRVQALGSDGSELNEMFQIEVTDRNDPPNQVLLSSRSVEENLPVGTIIGLLSTLDADVADSHTYRLRGELAVVSLLGINGDRLYSTASFNYETQPVLSFEIESVDRAGLRIVTPFRVSVEDANDPPVLLPLSVSVPENEQEGTLVGTIRATDPDEGQRISYRLFFSSNPEVVNDAFRLESNGKLYVEDGSLLDYERDQSIGIEVLAADDGTPVASSRKVYNIAIKDIAEQGLPASLIISPNDDGINDYWKVTNPQLYTNLELTIYNVSGQEVYKTLGYDNEWNGKLNNQRLPRGVYYYVFRDANGSIAYMGSISVL